MNSVLKINGSAYVELNKGANCRKNLSLIVDDGILVIEENCFFNNNCSIMCLKSIKIGKNSTFGPNVVIVDNDHDYKKVTNKKFITDSITIGENVWVGANCIILKGSYIGNNSVIAAGTIVNGNIPENTLYYQKRDTKMNEII